MLPEGYRVLDQAGHDIWVGSKERKPIDELSFAVAQNRHLLLLELADSTGSRIVAVPSNSPNGLEDTRQLFSDAESPAISPDGRHVAFIREIEGRGTLWIATLDQSLGKVESGPNQVRGPNL